MLRINLANYGPLSTSFSLGSLLLSSPTLPLTPLLHFPSPPFFKTRFPNLFLPSLLACHSHLSLLYPALPVQLHPQFWFFNRPPLQKFNRPSYPPATPPALWTSFPPSYSKPVFLSSFNQSPLLSTCPFLKVPSLN